MSKLRRGLGQMSMKPAKDSEPFGTPSSEPFRTDSKADNAVQFASGRPPVLDDTALQELARRMNSQLGRPPKADELIQEAGGCQRKRALAAIQILRLELAQRAVRSQLLFPPPIEAHLRALMAEWIDHAAAHLAQRHTEIIETHEERLEASSAHAEDLQNRLAELKEVASGSGKRMSQLADQVQVLTAERDQARKERDALAVIAAERQRVIDQLVLGPAANESEKASRVAL